MFGEFLRLARTRAGLQRDQLARLLRCPAGEASHIELVELGRLAPSSEFAAETFRVLQASIVCGRAHWMSVAALTADLKRDGVELMRSEDRDLLERIHRVFLQPNSPRAEVLRTQLRAIAEVAGVLG